jgi:UPF0755 protein
MKRFISFFFVMLIAAGVITVWLIFSSGTAFIEKSKYFIIQEGKTDRASVLDVLEKKYIIKERLAFSLLASQLHVWDKLKPGKYEVKQGQSLLSIARMLKNNHQAQINLVINKLRLKEDLAKLISKNFESDSTIVMQFLCSPDSLKQYNVDTNNVFTMIISDTYSFYWKTPLRKIFNKLFDASANYWSKNERIKKSEAIGLSPVQTYILASIVEEETNKDDDRAKIASVYLNRLNKDMPLQACPTIKFAMKDFLLTRIYDKYLSNPSPYNTYHKKGLPPGPICIPSPKTIDIVLNAPKTDFLFFVAKSDFSGYHHFSNNFAEHNQYAKEYQKALDEYLLRKQLKEEVPEP